KSPQNAGERLDQSGIVIAYAVGDEIRIALDDALRNPDVLGVGAVVEQQVFAKVLQAAATEEALVAGRGVGGDDTLPNAEGADVVADGDDVAGKLMSEDGRRDNHTRVVPAPEHLHISPA